MDTFSPDESKRLDEVADWYSTFDGFEQRLIEYGYQSIQPYFKGSTCLELGPADGWMTERLIEHFPIVTSVEGSSTFCEQLRSRIVHDGFEVAHSLFEDFESDRRYETGIAAHVLEHVDDPVALLVKAREWIAGDGRLIVKVPNARSFHRLLGVKMGAIESIYSFSERDHKVGHRRVYDADTLRADIESAGWTVETIVGSYFKIFSNEQSEQWFTQEMMDGFYELGKDFPEYGTMISAICTMS